MTGRSIDANIRRARSSRSGLGGLSSALIVIDVAVAVVAIGVAGGLWGKVQATKPSESVDGIRAAEILSVTLDVRSSQRQEVARAQAALVERLRREPDVRSVTFATALPGGHTLPDGQPGCRGCCGPGGRSLPGEHGPDCDRLRRRVESPCPGRGVDSGISKWPKNKSLSTRRSPARLGSTTRRQALRHSHRIERCRPWLEIVGRRDMGVNALTNRKRRSVRALEEGWSTKCDGPYGYGRPRRSSRPD